MKKPLRLGLLGAGNVVETYHLPVLQEMKEIKIAWICDKDLDQAQTLASIYGISNAFNSLSKCPDVDIVLITVPVGARRSVLQEVIPRRWNAFCEKPFALTFTDHSWMLTEARHHQVRLGIGLLRRKYLTTKISSRIVDAGILGPIELILGGEGMRIHRTGRGGDWYQANPQASGGTFFEMGSHLVDQIFNICSVKNYRIEKCKQRKWEGLELETNVRGEFEMENGHLAPFAMVVSRLNDVYNGIVIRCRNGEIRIDIVPNGTVKICDRSGKVIETLGVPEHRDNALYDAIRKEWKEFIDGCVVSTDFSDWDTGLLTTSFIDECYKLNEASLSIVNTGSCP